MINVIKNGDILFSGKDLSIIRNKLRKFKKKQKAENILWYAKQKKSDTNENT